MPSSTKKSAKQKADAPECSQPNKCRETVDEEQSGSSRQQQESSEQHQGSSEQHQGSSGQETHHPKDRDVVIGYIHNVQPTKKAQGTNPVPYFELTVQTEHSAQKALCYSPGKKRRFVDAMTSKSPIKIKKAASNNGTLMLHDSADIEVINPDDVQFQYNKQLASDAVVSIRDLHSLRDRQLISVKGNVSDIGLVENHYGFNGVIDRATATIRDNTSCVKLTLYGADINKIEKGKTYILKYVRLNIKKDRCYLNTSTEKAFQVEECAPFESLATDECTTNVKIISKIIGVSKFVASSLCPLCSRKCERQDETTVHCSSCSSNFNTEDCNQTHYATLVLRDTSTKQSYKVYFSNDRVHELSNIIEIGLEDDKLFVKRLLQIKEPFLVTFDAIKNSALSIKLGVHAE